MHAIPVHPVQRLPPRPMMKPRVAFVRSSFPVLRHSEWSGSGHIQLNMVEEIWARYDNYTVVCACRSVGAWEPFGVRAVVCSVA